MKTTDIQKALDRMVDSIDTSKLSAVLQAQMTTGPRCRICGAAVKNLRGLAVHGRTHRQ